MRDAFRFQDYLIHMRDAQADAVSFIMFGRKTPSFRAGI